MLDRLRPNEEDDIAVPVFDRDLEISRAVARMIPRAARTLIVDGDYLSLDHQPWSRLRAMFDMTVFVDAAEEVLLQRFSSTWRRQ
jgi:pantothenate kinase